MWTFITGVFVGAAFILWVVWVAVTGQAARDEWQNQRDAWRRRRDL